MMWSRILWLFLMFLLGKHLGFPSSTRYLELADSANIFIQKGNWMKAEEKIVEALRLEPANFSNSMLLANLGLVQIEKGEYNKAIETCSLGLNIAPSSTVLLNNRAHAYLFCDNIPEASADLDRSLAIDSIQEWALQTRAFIYLHEGDDTNAKKLFSKISAEFPNNTSVLKGKATLAKNNGDIPKALQYYKEVLELNENDEESREAYISLLIDNNQYSEARVQIKEGLKINPDNPMFYLLRGYLHRLNYRLEEAQADKRIALSKGLSSNFASLYIP